MPEDLTGKPERAASFLVDTPADKVEIANEFNVSPNTAKGYIEAIRDAGFTVDCEPPDYEYVPGEDLCEYFGENDDEREELNDREEYIYSILPKSESALAGDLGISERAVQAHLESIKEKGWPLEGDDAGNWLGPDQDHLRNSEHKQTRTRKANRWWQSRHDELVHEFQSLDWPRAEFDANPGHEDWVTHVTDLHAGDRVRRDDSRTIYETAMIPDVIDYITERSLSLKEKHGSRYDAAHLLWGGDFITNEGIYEGQHENLDAWLDEQHDILVDPLIRQLKAFSEEFPTVQVVCLVGNHGDHRASGTSKQANADLILYKHIRNTVAQIRKHADGVLENVQFVLGEAKPYRNFEMRDGRVTGHLRHGQNRRPQAETSARKNQWRGTLMDHEFDVAYMGHHHISGRIPWDGPPIFCTGSPKPAGEFVERLGGRSPRRRQDMATCHGVSDDGVTGVFPVDSRGFQLNE